MLYKRALNFAFVILLAICVAPEELLAAPNLVSYQGFLTDGSGVPLDGTYTISFTIYDAETGGFANWTETQPNVIVENGHFSVNLGSVNPLTESVFLGDERWLSVEISGEEISISRLVTVPYAHRTSSIDDATGGYISGDVAISSSLSVGQAGSGGVLDVNDGTGEKFVTINTNFRRIGIGIDGTFPNTLFYASGEYNDANQHHGMISDVENSGAVTAIRGAASSSADGHVVGVDASGVSDGVQRYGLYGSARPSNTSLTTGVSRAVYGQAMYGNSAFAVDGFAANAVDGYGVRGIAQSNSSFGYGVYGSAQNSTNANIGVYGFAPVTGAQNWAGRFNGDVSVTGSLSKGGGAFKIDHPLDPENKYLQHSFVESPDMMNIYNGNVTTDGRGFATVKMPDYFEALNRDFRYQLTVIGQFAQAIVSQKLSSGEFVIQTNLPHVEVSWQLTGIRKDPWADAHRIEVEVEKDAADRGSFLHPEEYGYPRDYALDKKFRPDEEEIDQHRMKSDEVAP